MRAGRLEGWQSVILEERTERARPPEIRNDGVARWLLGDNAAVGTARFLLLALVYIVGSVLILNWLLR
jgi:hypothetical protein